MKLFADEDFDQEAQRRGASDEEQLAHATAEERALLTFNRADFHALHRGVIAHAGIITCTRDPDVEVLAIRIHAAIAGRSGLAGEVVRVVRGRPG